MNKYIFNLTLFLSSLAVAQNPILINDFNNPPIGVLNSHISKLDSTLILRYNNTISSFKVTNQSFQVLNSNIYIFGDNANLNGAMLFNGWNKSDSFGNELWRTDGSSSGTYLIKDINPNTNTSSTPQNFKCINNYCYFSAQGLNGRELWRTDGTNSGTIEVKNINSGTNSSNPFGMEELNGILYFFANNNANGYELWRSDGTEIGTYLVKDICLGGCSSRESFYSYDYSTFTKVGNFLFFFAYTDQNGVELWKTDGTSQGTTLVKDIISGITSSFSFSNEPSQIEMNGILYFSANDIDLGIELWRSDGTEAGTYLVKDINPNNNESNRVARESFPSYFSTLNNKIYFVAFHPSYGREIWVSDGTATGTQLLKNINTSTSNERFNSSPPISNCKGFVVKDDKIFFTLDNGINGKEMWNSNGTLTGTSLLFELNNGAASSFDSYFNNSDIVSIDNKLYFFGNNGVVGNSLWSYELCSNNLNLTAPNNNISNSTVVYKSSDLLRATNIISNSNVTYTAGNKVELNNGFSVQNGSVFKAEIGGCN